MQAPPACWAVTGSQAAWPRSAPGALLQLVYPGEFSYFLVAGGPDWPVWVALGGAAVGLVAGAIVRRSVPAGASDLDERRWRSRSSPRSGSRASPTSSRTSGSVPPQSRVSSRRSAPQVPAGDVVFSDLETSYRIEGYAPVYVSAAPPAHVADTKDNYPQKRREAVIRFLNSGSVSIPRRFHADWIVVANRRFDLKLDLPKAYEDSRFTLYRLCPARVLPHGGAGDRGCVAR